MTLLDDAWTVALEALSWVDLLGMNEDAALRKALKQLRVKDRVAADDAGTLLYEVMKRCDMLDYLINSALEPYEFCSLDADLRGFMRLYPCMHECEGFFIANLAKDEL